MFNHQVNPLYRNCWSYKWHEILGIKLKITLAVSPIQTIVFAVDIKIKKSFFTKPASFCLFSFFSHYKNKCSTNLTIIDESIDCVLGSWTWDYRMEGSDESTELWRHQKNLIFHKIYQKFSLHQTPTQYLRESRNSVKRLTLQNLKYSKSCPQQKDSKEAAAEAT